VSGHTRLKLILGAILLLTCVAACGDGGHQVSSNAPPSDAATTAASTTAAAAATTTTTGAASFRVPGADNSIPDFGGEAPVAERERAAAALAAFLNARAGGRWAKACAYLARATHTQLERVGGAAKGNAGGCGMALRALSSGGGGGTSGLHSETLAGAVAALRVEGKRAFALYHGRDKGKYVMPMVNEGEVWKVGELAPLSYPIGASGAVP
jgi:hypothetical protein